MLFVPALVGIGPALLFGRYVLAVAFVVIAAAELFAGSGRDRRVSYRWKAMGYQASGRDRRPGGGRQPQTSPVSPGAPDPQGSPRTSTHRGA